MSYSFSATKQLNEQISEMVEDYYKRCDQALVQRLGCFCKVAEAAQQGRLDSVMVSGSGVWQLILDDEVIEELDISRVWPYDATG